MGPVSISPVFPWWVIILLFGVGLALISLQYRISREKLGLRRALALSLLRACVFLLLIAVALNPAMVRREGRAMPLRLAVLLDTSQSMGQGESKGGGSRLDKAKALLTGGDDPLLQSLNDQYDVSLFALGGSFKPLEANDLARLQAGGEKGDLGEALKTIEGRHDIALLLSDGNLKWRPGEAASIPLLALPMGDRESYRDIMIKEVKAPALAFRGREALIEVIVKGYGYRDLTLPLLLKESGKLLAAVNVRLPAEGVEVTASLSFIPETTGRKVLSLSLPPQVGENVTANNQRLFSLQVAPDKARILMVSGSPSMNYRYLRTALKSDPFIDLLSFVILRTPSDVLNVPLQEQSLIPFPVETLFMKELATFDLVIFDNFDYSIYLRSDYLESLRKFVKEGGSLALIGGPNVFNEGIKGRSPLADALPFRFTEREYYRRERPVRVRLGPSASGHPLMRLGDELSKDEARERLFWQEMPPLDGINVTDAKRGATVLLETAEGIPLPVLTVSEYGKGRVLALGTDYSWKWYTGLVARGKSGQPYLRLVHRMVRWLVKDPELEPVQITLPSATVWAGQDTDVRIHVMTGNPGSASGAGPGRESQAAPDRRPGQAPSFSLFNPEGDKIESRLKDEGKPGDYLLSFLPGQAGVYRLEVETPLGRQEESLVAAGILERLDAAPDHEGLKKIAEAMQGKYLAPGEDLLKTVAGYARTRQRQFIEERSSPLWASPLVMGLILALLACEWYLRRRWGLI